jgi:hypothetical protein
MRGKAENRGVIALTHCLRDIKSSITPISTAVSTVESAASKYYRLIISNRWAKLFKATTRRIPALNPAAVISLPVSAPYYNTFENKCKREIDNTRGMW